MLDTVDFNHVQHISFTQSRLTDAVSVILNGLLSYEHPPNGTGLFLCALVGLGLRKLSMSASQLAKVKRALSRHTAVQLQRLAGEILACEDAGEVLQCMQAALAL